MRSRTTQLARAKGYVNGVADRLTGRDIVLGTVTGDRQQEIGGTYLYTFSPLCQYLICPLATGLRRDKGHLRQEADE